MKSMHTYLEWLSTSAEKEQINKQNLQGIFKLGFHNIAGWYVPVLSKI